MPRPIDRELREDLDLTPLEKALLASATTANTAEVTRASALTGIYVTKHLRRMVDDLIESNALVADVSRRHTKALTLLTAALVLVGIAGVAVQVLQVFGR